MWETYGLALFNFTASLISVKFITCTAPQIRNFKFRSKGKNSTVQLKLTGEIFTKEINVLFFCIFADSLSVLQLQYSFKWRYCISRYHCKKKILLYSFFLWFLLIIPQFYIFKIFKLLFLCFCGLFIRFAVYCMFTVCLKRFMKGKLWHHCNCIMTKINCWW